MKLILASCYSVKGDWFWGCYCWRCILCVLLLALYFGYVIVGDVFWGCYCWRCILGMLLLALYFRPNKFYLILQLSIRIFCKTITKIVNRRHGLLAEWRFVWNPVPFSSVTWYSAMSNCNSCSVYWESINLCCWIKDWEFISYNFQFVLLMLMVFFVFVCLFGDWMK